MIRRAAACLLLASCVSPAPLEERRGSVDYAYAAYDRTGTEVAAGILTLPELLPGEYTFRGVWRVRAQGDHEERRLQDGSGALIGSFRDGRLTVDFHPDTIGTDREFTLTGILTREGAAGTWGYATEAGHFPGRGTFTIRR